MDYKMTCSTSGQHISLPLPKFDCRGIGKIINANNCFEDFTANRASEKLQMQQLNDKFASHIEKVRVLEQQSATLNIRLEQLRVAGTSRIEAHYEKEMREIRRQVDQLTNEKARVEMERDNLVEEIKRTRERLQEEVTRRKEAEKNRLGYKRDMESATLVSKNLECKVNSLDQHIKFLKTTHGQEMNQLWVQIKEWNLQFGIELAKPDLSAALCDIRKQYEILMAWNRKESDDCYQSKFKRHTEALARSMEATQEAKHEANNYRLQLQTVTLDKEALKGMIKSLESQIAEREKNFNIENDKCQNTITRLEHEVQNMTDKMAHQLHKYQDLFNVKMALELEIATYRELLQSEENRVSTTLPKFTLNVKDTIVETGICTSVKTLLTGDGEARQVLESTFDDLERTPGYGEQGNGN